MGLVRFNRRDKKLKMISSPGQRPPYAGTAAGYPHAPNAALLIDFDNVTMGIRSDLGKELKSLLNSEVIRGKVAVQRAYADWRRYPQYIVPLAESSIDLIFAPAYGSAKKNATDLRMAIDAIELVFTRPEIGTFILMTGDSDFSSCVLKLKEYGKYVIGVGMRESSSDLLIQNCDEYYSYHSLSGLTRAGEVQESKEDPWVLMKRAAQQMEVNGDVMRTDRLKQVMLDLDPAFDEKKIGYSKFSRFVQEAASKGIVQLRKGENGQFEIVRTTAAEDPESAVPVRAETASAPAADGRRGRGRGRERDGRRDARPPRREDEAAAPEVVTASAAESAEPAVAAETVPAESAAAAASVAAPVAAPAETAAAPAAAASAAEPSLDQAYRLLQAALRDIVGSGSKSVRDGDVKRRMLDMLPDFDESTLGFAKFTRFLRQAHDAEIVDLQRSGAGNYEVSLPASGKRLPAPSLGAVAAKAAPREETAAPRQQPAAKAPAEPAAAEVEAPAAASAAPASDETATRSGGGVGALRGRRGGRAGAASGPPPILPGQAVTRGAAAKDEPAVEEDAVAAGANGSAEAEAAAAEEKKKPRRGRRGRGRSKNGEAAAADTTAAADSSPAEAAAAPQPEAEPAAKPSRPAVPEGPIDKITARARRGRALRGDADERATAPPILPGQAVKPPVAPASAETAAAPVEKAAAPADGRTSRTRRAGAGRKLADPTPSKSNEGRTPMPEGLPSDRAGVVAHLSAYKGVGVKSAETLFDAFGEKTFEALQGQRERVQELLGARRAGAVLEQWEADFAERLAAAAPPAPSPKPAAKATSAGAKPKKPASGGRGRGKTAAAEPKKTSTAASKRKAAPAAETASPAEEKSAPAKRSRSGGSRGGRGRGGKASEPSS